MECRVTPAGNGYPDKEPLPTLLSFSFLTQQLVSLFPRQKNISTSPQSSCPRPCPVLAACHPLAARRPCPVLAARRPCPTLLPEAQPALPLQVACHQCTAAELLVRRSVPITWNSR